MTPGSIDTRAFMQMCNSMSRMPIGRTLQQVTDHEVGKVIEKTVALIPAAKVSKIKSDMSGALFSAQPAGMYTPQTVSGTKGRAKAKRHGPRGKILYYLGNRYPNALWAKIEEARKKALIAKLRARGLAKHSFYEIARILDLASSVPGYVKTATPSTGRSHDSENLAARRKSGGSAYGLSFENAQPTVNLARVGGARALQRAINGRVSYFRQGAAKGWHDGVAKIARRYPGLKIGPVK